MLKILQGSLNFLFFKLSCSSFLSISIPSVPPSIEPPPPPFFRLDGYDSFQWPLASERRERERRLSFRKLILCEILFLNNTHGLFVLCIYLLKISCCWLNVLLITCAVFTERITESDVIFIRYIRL